MLVGGIQALPLLKSQTQLPLFKGLRHCSNPNAHGITITQCTLRQTGSYGVGSRKWVQSRLVRKSHKREDGLRVSASPNKENFNDPSELHSVNEVQDGDGECLYLKRSVQSGELVQHHGSVIVLGDVNVGGTVVAGKDIVILGKLSGKAHAGRGGHESSSILLLGLEPCGILSIHNVKLVFETSNQCKPHIFLLGDNGTIRKNALPIGMENLSKDVGHRSKIESQPTKIAFFTGAYISLIGIAVLFYPKSVFGFFFDLQTISVGWIRVLGTLAVVFGVYYIGAALGDLLGERGSYFFYMSTVVGRSFLFASFCWIFVQHAAPLALFYVGAINLLGALLMLRALKESKVREF